MTKHIDKLEKNRGLILQLSIIISLLIVLVIFEFESKSNYEFIGTYTEINIEFEKTTQNKRDISPPKPCAYKPDISNSTNISVKEGSINKINFNIDKQAEFPGGKLELEKYIKENKIYTEITKKKNIQGRVNVSFSINENGKIKNAKIIRSIHPVLDKEALRLIKKMPDWTPAEINGEPIESNQILPIMFLNKNY